MLMLISPAKTLDYDSPAPTRHASQPDFLDRSAELIAILRQKSPAELAALMSISDPLAVLNAARYQEWCTPFTAENSKQAVFAFMGDVYEGLAAATLDDAAIAYLQAHLRILSGLYGLLRPLDLMQPYRLEMGTRLTHASGKNLYDFWGDSLTAALNPLQEGSAAPVWVNLASEEYFKAVRPKLLRGRVVTPVFEDWKNGQYKVISFHAKRARGLMVRYAASHSLADPEMLKAFDLEGYAYAAEASAAQRWVFRRREG